MHNDDPKLWSHELLCDRYQLSEAARLELVSRLIVLSHNASSEADKRFARAGVHIGQAILSGLAEPTR